VKGAVGAAQQSSPAHVVLFAGKRLVKGRKKMSTLDSLWWLKHLAMMTYGVPVLSVGAALIITRWLDNAFS
jgi:hypothetical protein